MKSDAFAALLDSLSTLTSSQREEVEERLLQISGRNKVQEIVQGLRPSACTACGSVNLVKNGTARGMQRYVCKDCKCTTNPISHSPIARLHKKEKFQAYAKCMAEGLPLRETARIVGIALSTAFRWRHRFLQSVVAHQPEVIEGILEVDETYFRISHKGQRGLDEPRSNGSTKGLGRGRSRKHWQAVLVGRARGTPLTLDAVMPSMSRFEVERALARHLDPNQTIVCCDGSTSFENIPTNLKVPIKVAVASYKSPDKCPTYHVQSVNSYHSELKKFINGDLKGVATKNLPHYLAWKRLLKWEKEGLLPEDYIRSAIGLQVINTKR